MKDEYRKQAIQAVLNQNRRLKGKDKVECRYQMKYPASVEREYKRFLNSYMVVLKSTLEQELPNLKSVIQDSSRADSNDKDRRLIRLSDFKNKANKIESVFESIESLLYSAIGIHELKRKLSNMANMTKKLTVQEWKKALNKTLAIDILEDYYMGDFYQDMLEKWVNDNVNLIVTIPRTMLTEMKQQVYDGFINGKPTTQIMKSIQKEYAISKTHAKLLARDQLSKLNSNITKAQQEDAGVTEYKWRTVGDGRVRERHSDLDGKIFSWSNPPIVDIKTGRRCHPGEDYQCRCIAIPVINLKALDVPIAQAA